MSKEIVHTGLFAETDKEVELLVKRVADFNARHIGYPVKMDIIPFQEGDREITKPHYKLKFLYPDHEIKKAFWAN